MRKNKTTFELLYDYPCCTVFVLGNPDYLGVDEDNNIYIGTVEEEVYGTKYACEGYHEETISSEEDIDHFFEDVAQVNRVNGNKTERISKEDFLNLIKSQYRELAKEIDFGLDR